VLARGRSVDDHHDESPAVISMTAPAKDFNAAFDRLSPGRLTGLGAREAMRIVLNSLTSAKLRWTALALAKAVSRAASKID
jgi:hypothetical protein